MNESCPYCDKPNLSQYIGLDGELLCQECARREIIGVLTDLDQDETKKLRRRIEDALRKNPSALQDVAALLIMQGVIIISPEDI